MSEKSAEEPAEKTEGVEEAKGDYYNELFRMDNSNTGQEPPEPEVQRAKPAPEPAPPSAPKSMPTPAKGGQFLGLETPSPPAKPASTPATAAPPGRAQVHLNQPKPAAPPATPLHVDFAPPPVLEPAAQAATNSAPTSPEGHAQVLAESTVTGFVNALNAQAAKRGGHLLAKDIEALSRSFEKQTKRIASSISQSISVYAESYAQAQWDPERVDAFNRVLVKQFSKLLQDDEEVAKNPQTVPRRALKGVFAALRIMVGPERLERYEQDAYLVMQRVRFDKESEFSWEAVYADPRVKNMIRDLLIYLAPHFIDIARRIEWLSDVVNGQRAPVSPKSPVADWQATPNTMFLVVESLFSELRTSVMDDAVRERMKTQYGADSLLSVKEALKSLNRYRTQNF